MLNNSYKYTETLTLDITSSEEVQTFELAYSHRVSDPRSISLVSN